jgi:hypothetical protein
VLWDSEGCRLDVDVRDGDQLADLVSALESPSLHDRPDVELVGSRHDPIYRLDLATAAAIEVPASLGQKASWANERAHAITSQLEDGETALQQMYDDARLDGEAEIFDASALERYSAEKERLADVRHAQVCELAALIRGLS